VCGLSIVIRRVNPNVCAQLGSFSFRELCLLFCVLWSVHCTAIHFGDRTYIKKYRIPRPLSKDGAKIAGGHLGTFQNIDFMFVVF